MLPALLGDILRHRTHRLEPELVILLLGVGNQLFKHPDASRLVSGFADLMSGQDEPLSELLGFGDQRLDFVELLAVHLDAGHLG